MLMVIIGHISYTFYPYVYSALGAPWKVAIFFMVAGFYLKDAKIAEPYPFIKSKLKGLYVPALVIYAGAVLLHNVFVNIGWYPLGCSHPATGVLYTLYGIKEFVIGLIKVLIGAGSGELAMGAMWFLYVLLYSMIGLCGLNWVLSKMIQDVMKRNRIILLITFLLAIISGFLTSKYSFTVSRLSVTFTAMFLIWAGKNIQQRFNIKYDNRYCFLISVLVFAQSVMFMNVGQNLAANVFPDFLVMVVSGFSVIYILGYIGRKIQSNIVGRFLAWMGRESLYLMAFHITGFFVCNSLLVKLGIFTSDAPKGLYTYIIGDNWILLFTYIFFAIATSFAILYTYRGFKSSILKLVKK